MTRVYLTEQGSTAHVRGGRLLVEKAGSALLRLPIERVGQIVVVNKGVQLSTALLLELLARGVEVVYLSRAGRYYGQMSGAAGGGAALRAAQYARLGDPAGRRPLRGRWWRKSSPGRSRICSATRGQTVWQCESLAWPTRPRAPTM